MATKKKLVDLVHLDENVNEHQLKTEYLTRIASWERWIKQRQSDDVITMSRYMEENAEYYAIEGWIGMFLKKRLEWITESVPDPETRLRYLRVLPPFSQQGNIKQFLLHFFQLADHTQQSKIVFSGLNQQEKELRVLWDMYKLTRTMETIRTLKKWVAGRNPSSSQSGGSPALKGLENLQKSLTMIFKICISRDYQNRYLQHFPKDVFLPESILHRRETGHCLVNQKILESLEYRNFLFFIYYKPKIRGELDGKTYDFEINYLDYEIIRQEFLIHWISQRLKTNPRKQKVFEQYKLGSKTFAQITANRPEMEISLLKKLPKNVFDDLMARVSDGLDPDQKAPVATMSESFGSFARDIVNFEKAKVLARKSVDAIRSFIAKSEERKKPVESAPPDKPPAEEAPQKTPRPPKELRIQLVQADEISYPFFCENNSHFSRLIKLFRMKIDPARYIDLNAKIEIFLSQAPEDIRIIRRSPRHEWSIPVVIFEPDDAALSKQLLILGAELKNRQMGMGYQSESETPYTFQSYFVYGAVKKYVDLGIINENRRVKGDRYYIYDPSHPTVIHRALKLVNMVIERQDTLFPDTGAPM